MTAENQADSGTPLRAGALVVGGRFKVLSHLGGGGMSEVYLAEQVSLGRKVALKVLRPDVARKVGAGERFRREAQLLSTVDHPSVVRVIDFDRSAQMTCLVLELAEGDTLDDVLTQGPMDVGRALAILTQLAEGLAAIHDKGIVHRDLKPHNVVLSHTPRGEQARLLDFGIARLAEVDDRDPTLSIPGQVVGTPAYLSPEQAQGQPTDARSDIYSFGVMAYQMLTGVYPYPGPSARDYVLQHITHPPRRIEEQVPALREHAELCLLVMRCLEKDPARRPISGRSLLEELGRLPRSTPRWTQLPASETLASLRGSAEPGEAESTRVIRLPKEALTSAWLREAGRTLRIAGAGALRLARGVATRAGRIDRRWRQTALVVLAIFAATPIVYQLLPKTPAARARALLERGHPDRALPLIDAALLTPSGDTPGLLAMKAAALHQLQRHAEESQVLHEHLHQALYSGEPMLLDALAEDFARTEEDPTLRELMAAVPAEALRERFLRLAQRPPSPRQWGALRYLDLTNSHEQLDRVELYASALLAPDCKVRAAAAKRLAELGDPDAIPALRRLSETPKQEWRQGGKNCGQDEAADAIRALHKQAALGAR